ncbi:MAG: flagellar biosynthesis anti-sigma factor FlgM [Candidatus Nitrohelix vancouverensis]|uniref:Negative regulator of flagellin synthesis n=1 Tax=Candidatus Nitrohelix vancouverensis TaxID=2705534 RepID=A0A7T0G4L1_9BACT|nr:MAG: flagellar biosynthesis anti-sigma factor FlgM [Candidatus Nitrohelix vancouverensis]
MEIPGNEFRVKNKTIQDRMKVDGKAASKKADAASGSSSVSNTVNVQVSSFAKDVQKAHEALGAAPDIRTEKVERIKKEIAEGRFHVDSNDLAEKILKDIITESDFLS